MSPEPNKAVTAKIFQLQLLAEVRAPTHTGGPIREGRAEAFQKRRNVKNNQKSRNPNRGKIPHELQNKQSIIPIVWLEFYRFSDRFQGGGRLGRIGPPVWVGARTSESDCN